MKVQTETTPHHLLTCFFTECESQFRFLEQKHDFGYFSGLVEYRQGRQIIKPYNNQKVLEPFWAATRYEKENVALEILYGDREFVLEGFATYNRIHRFSWSEILSGAKKDEDSFAGNIWITQPEHIVRAIEKISKSARDYINILEAPAEKVMERALTMRGKRMKQSIFEQYKKAMDHAVKMASIAFVEKDYRRVIEIYTPYEKHLSKADLKKLHLARKKIIEGLVFSEQD